MIFFSLALEVIQMKNEFVKMVKWEMNLEFSSLFIIISIYRYRTTSSSIAVPIEHHTNTHAAISHINTYERILMRMEIYF